METFNVYHGKNAPFNIWLNTNNEENQDDEKNKNVGNVVDEENYVDDNNRPMLLFANKEPKFGVYSCDFVKIRDKKELFACGCSDGGVRIYSLMN